MKIRKQYKDSIGQGETFVHPPSRNSTKNTLGERSLYRRGGPTVEWAVARANILNIMFL